MNSSRQRLTLIASLYVSQAIPLGFFIVAIPAILRSEGVGLAQVGLLSALAFPWLIKFLWAPLVDRFGSVRHGHYRSWILVLQSLTVLAVIALAWVDLHGGWGLLFTAGAAFMLCSATQDIATDGLAVRSMPPEERGPANGIQVGGYYFGQILGGGAMLMLFGRFGWTPALLAMALFLALPLIPVLRFREPASVRPAGVHPIDFGAFRRFVQRPGARIWIGILLLYRSGEATAQTMVNPMLVDLGFSLGEIGLMLGLAGSLAAFAGAMVGGWSIARIGRKPALVLFGIIQAFALCGYALPGLGLASAATVYAVAAVAAFCGGMATAALYTNMMDRCDAPTAATDFTLQQSLCAIGPLLGSGLSGFSASLLGYPLHFVMCGAIAAAAAVITLRWMTAGMAIPVAVPATGSVLARQA
jgi:MFS transporter, PAT family, beta-lactamase induction signal transducer AmpG